MNELFVNLYGGLGNQLFQLFLAKRIANETKSNININLSLLDKYNSVRKYEIYEFAEYFCQPKYINDSYAINNLILKLRLANLFNIDLFGYHLFNKYKYFDINECVNKQYFFMDGYFQDPATIKTLDIEYARTYFLNKYQNIIQNHVGIDTIAVHIRRGDYLNKDNASIFKIIGFDYYDICLRRIDKSLNNCLIFSDDNNVAEDFSSRFGGLAVHRLNLDLLSEFSLFSACNYQIISNSTFSWWASFLGYNSNKIIFSPEHWYVNAMPCSNKLLLRHMNLV